MIIRKHEYFQIRMNGCVRCNHEMKLFLIQVLQGYIETPANLQWIFMIYFKHQTRLKPKVNLEANYLQISFVQKHSSKERNCLVSTYLSSVPWVFKQYLRLLSYPMKVYTVLLFLSPFADFMWLSTVQN